MNLAPNGNPSNLTPEQYRLVRTPEFKEWFGDWENDPANASKVVDENGEPLVVYHGTNEYQYFRSSNPNEKIYFDPKKSNLAPRTIGGGVYFTSNIIIAERFSDMQFAVECFLSLKNPKIIDGFEKDIEEIIPQENPIKYLNNDSIIVKNTYDAFGDIVGVKKFLSDIFIVKKSTQIKLADGTNTTFDGSNPDIRFSKGGEVLLAPNGNPSNLTPEQYRLVRTPAFKKWFGDWEKKPKTASKVIDENGEPMVVFHGSPKKINKFSEKKSRGGFYFFNNKDEAQGWAGYSDGYNSGYIYQCFLSIKTPFKADNYRDIQHSDWSYIDRLESFGHDGIIWMPNFDEIVAFEPTQIKLADGTNTTFDSNNPDIRYAEGGYLSERIKTITLNESDYNNLSNSDTVDKFNSILSKLGITIKVIEKLGKGKLGYAFLTDNGNVVKLTDNKQEALASFIFLNHKNNLKTQAKIFNVLQFVYNQSYFYLIEREYIKDVVSDLYEKEKYKEFIDYVFGYAQENIPYRKKTDNDLQVLSYKYYDSMLSYAKESDNVFYSYLIENKDEFINKTFQVFVFYRDVVSDILLTGVRYNDVHYGNLGFHNNKLICFDCISTDSKNINSPDIRYTTFDSNNPDIRYAEGGIPERYKNLGFTKVPDLLSSQEIEQKLGRKLHWWNDDVVIINGTEYKKVFLKPEYKRL